MPTSRSAGLLMYREGPSGLQVLLAHPGGPFWKHRDQGAWSLPKGELSPGEDAQAAACREFTEETGFAVCPPLLPLGELRQKGGKCVTAWAFQGEADPAQLRCNLFELEWPPRSGRLRQFPEIDRVEWFSLAAARGKLLASQQPFLDRLEDLLAAQASP
jgi:predicted NUDIX family NTP pyrophosphohydrolase